MGCRWVRQHGQTFKVRSQLGRDVTTPIKYILQFTITVIKRTIAMTTTIHSKISNITLNRLCSVTLLIPGRPVLDGDVQITRVIGTSALLMLDPFLLLDMFYSDEPRDYLAGFPSHPHRGFEVSYILAGRMRHEDNKGHRGVIEPGEVQWMTAGRGIVHSEMPQASGLLWGFQLWINLPAAQKGTPLPGYRQ